MNTEPVIRPETTPRLVDWFPRTRRTRVLAPEAVQAGAVAAGVFVVAAVAVAGFILARSAHRRLRRLEVDRLVVRNLTVLQNAARMQ